MKRLCAVSLIAALGLLAFRPSTASAATGTYEADKVPGVHASIDCSRGTGYVQIGNTDMATTNVEVSIDGVRQPDLHVDSRGEVQQWYALAPNQPHRLSIVYDFVPGGTAEEVDQVMTVSCLDGAPTTATTGEARTDAPPPSTGVSPVPAGSRFTPVSPARVWDSRFGPGPTGQVGAGQTREVTVAGVGGVPLTGVTAVALNVTAVNPSAGTYVTAWPTGDAKPLASNLNVPPGDVRANLVVVKVGADGKVSFGNAAGAVDLVADVAGYYGTEGA